MAVLTVRLTPRSSSNALTKHESGVLHLRVTAAPSDGAANRAVTALLASTLGVPSREVVLVSGATARVKRFELPIDEPEIELRIRAALDRQR